MINELISIIIPTYNRKHTIKDCLESVLNQTYSNLEIIIIDDGSIDGTNELINTYHDLRIKYVYKKNNQGVSAARNTGIHLATGNYIAFQDSDDIWYYDKIQKQLDSMIANPSMGFCYHKIQYSIDEIYSAILPDENISLDLKSGYIYKQMLYDNLIPAPTLFAKTSILKNIGEFDSQLPALEDYDYALRLTKKYQGLFINEILLDARYSTDGISGNSINYLLASCDILYKFKSDYIKYNQLNHRLEIILKDAERLGLRDYFIKLLEKIMIS